MEEDVPKWKNVSETLDNLHMHVQRLLEEKITSTAYVVYTSHIPHHPFPEINW
jgi:hypothetical protein